MPLGHRRKRVCPSAGRVTTGILLSFLAASAHSAFAALEGSPAQLPQVPISPELLPGFQCGEHDFVSRIEIFELEIEANLAQTLRHVFHHGTHRDPQLHKRRDIPQDTTAWLASDDETGVKVPARFHARSGPMRIQRLADRRPSTIESMYYHSRLTGQAATLSPAAWTFDEIPGPNITDKDTVLAFAAMTQNAYVAKEGDPEWLDVPGSYNYSQSFGWEGDGLRGHIFADQNNSTIVMTLKGTSVAVFDGAETTTNDKVNDNLFFSCCCGQGGQYLWRQVCDCSSSTYTCNSTCVLQALHDENRYYRAALDLYSNVTALYPDSDLWLVGHSLGGSVSSLLGQTYGLPTITFEAPGEALAARRLGLPSPPGTHPGAPQTRQYTGSYHFGHTADPIYMGTCNGATSGCTLGGYAMETRCHTGFVCEYDTVGDLGWRVGIGTHRVMTVIKDVIMRYEKTPKCESDAECQDCFLWKYFESNGSDTTTSSSASSTSSTQTRTETCKTPGWWGCLDESTTAPGTTSTHLSTTSTSTCETPGWFGCKDPTSTTSIVTTPAPVPTKSSLPTGSNVPSSSCKHPGFFGGCKDPTSTSSQPTSHDSCQTRGIFWGCRDSPGKSKTHDITSAPIQTLSLLSQKQGL